MKKEELKKEIMELRWNALPYYERWVYPKDICKENYIHVKEQLKAQQWQVKSLQTAIVALFIVSALSIYSSAGWRLSLFCFISATVLFGVESILKKRLQLLRKAVKLRKKLKKKSKPLE